MISLIKELQQKISHLEELLKIDNERINDNKLEILENRKQIIEKLKRTSFIIDRKTGKKFKFGNYTPLESSGSLTGG